MFDSSVFRSGESRLNMFRPGLVATLSALILTGCVSTYGYRAGQGGDYYYAEPSVDYYDGYGSPYGSVGYGNYGGWYGSVGYGFGGGYTPYSRYGFPYGYYGDRYGYPYYLYRRTPHHRPPHRPPPDTTPPGTLPPGVIDDGGPRIGDRERNRDGGPWRHLERPRGRIMTPQPGIQVGRTPPPGVVLREDTPRRRIMVTQPSMTGGQDRPGNVPRVQAPSARPASVSQPRVVREPPAASPAPQRRVELPERESRPGTTP